MTHTKLPSTDWSRRRDGLRFLIRPAKDVGSPLEVSGVDAGLTREKIVDLVRESRRSTDRMQKNKSSPGLRIQSTGRNRRRVIGTRLAVTKSKKVVSRAGNVA